MDIGAVMGIVTAVGAVALYVIRAELRGDVSRIDGRINAHEAGCSQRQKQLDERYAETNHKLESIDQKLDRLVESR